MQWKKLFLTSCKRPPAFTKLSISTHGWPVVCFLANTSFSEYIQSSLRILFHPSEHRSVIKQFFCIIYSFTHTSLNFLQNWWDLEWQKRENHERVSLDFKLSYEILFFLKFSVLPHFFVTNMRRWKKCRPNSEWHSLAVGNTHHQVSLPLAQPLSVSVFATMI